MREQKGSRNSFDERRSRWLSFLMATLFCVRSERFPFRARKKNGNRRSDIGTKKERSYNHELASLFGLPHETVTNIDNALFFTGNELCHRHKQPWLFINREYQS